jgi:hypothetical protein
MESCAEPGWGEGEGDTVGDELGMVWETLPVRVGETVSVKVGVWETVPVKVRVWETVPVKVGVGETVPDCDAVGEVEGSGTGAAANPLSTPVKLAATTSAGATGVKRLETLAVSRALAYACRTPPRATCAVAVLAMLLWRAAAVLELATRVYV